MRAGQPSSRGDRYMWSLQAQKVVDCIRNLALESGEA